MSNGFLEGFFNIPYGPQLWHALASYPHDLANKFNTMLKYTEVRCRGHWWLYVQTALPALGEVVLALLDFGFDDVLRGFFRPYGPRSRLSFRPSRRAVQELEEEVAEEVVEHVPRARPQRGAKILKKFEIPEIGELIGEHIPGAKLVKARAVTSAERFLWTLDGFAQKALYYWMIFDLIFDFYYNWMIGIIKSPECAHGALGGYIEKSTYSVATGPGGWQTVGHNGLTRYYFDRWGYDVGSLADGFGNPEHPVHVVALVEHIGSLFGVVTDWEVIVRDMITGAVWDSSRTQHGRSTAVVAQDVPPGWKATVQLRFNADRSITQFYYNLETMVFIP